MGPKTLFKIIKPPIHQFGFPRSQARKHGVNEETTKSDAALAVQSIPAYVELSNLFIALVPELTHKDSGLIKAF